MRPMTISTTPRPRNDAARSAPVRFAMSSRNTLQTTAAMTMPEAARTVIEFRRMPAASSAMPKASQTAE